MSLRKTGYQLTEDNNLKPSLSEDAILSILYDGLATCLNVFLLALISEDVVLLSILQRTHLRLAVKHCIL